MVVTAPSIKRLIRNPVGLVGTHTFAHDSNSLGFARRHGKITKMNRRPASRERPSGSLLYRLMTPGLTPAALRKEMIRQPGCTEVLGDSRGVFHPEVVPEWFPELVRFLQGYYSAALRDWSRPQSGDNWSFWKPRLDWRRITPFQRLVLEVVGEIPSGDTLTYGQVAKRIGKPAASRAVGAAVGANPWPVLVPCHRVMGASGKLTGFSAPGGIETKRRMLELESG